MGYVGEASCSSPSCYDDSAGGTLKGVRELVLLTE